MENIEQSLDYFFNQEKLTDENRYFCDSCGSKVTAKKGYILAKSPNTLVLHLKRFNYFQQKIPTKIKFGEVLSETFTKVSLDKSEYELYALIEHRGRSLSSGHYYSYVKNRDDDQWYWCNDSVIRKVDPQRIFSSQAYMLAYRKVTSLNEEEVRSNISMSSFGTVLKQSILSKKMLDEDLEFGQDSFLSEINMQKLGSIDLRELTKKLNSEKKSLSLMRSISDFQNFQQINASVANEAQPSKVSERKAKFTSPIARKVVPNSKTDQKFGLESNLSMKRTKSMNLIKRSKKKLEHSASNSKLTKSKEKKLKKG